MNRNNIKWCWLVMAVLLSVTQVEAKWGRNEARPSLDREKISDKIVQQLALDKDQQAQFRAGEERMQLAMKKNRTELKKLTQALQSELQKEQPDRCKIEKILNETSTKRTAMQLQRIDRLLNLKKMLKPEQKNKFQEIFKRPSRGRTGWGHKRQGRS